MTQLLNPIDLSEFKHLQTDICYLEDRRPSGRIEELENIFYGNRLNRCNAANLSPDEKKSKGYRDGLKSVQTQSLHNDPHYNTGWALGDPERQRLQLAEEGLAIIYGDADISRVLPDLVLWQGRKLPHEIVEIRYFADEKQYNLCASVELIDRELPF